MAFWKIVGLLVTPTTCWSSTRSLQVAGPQPVTTDVVEPDRDSLGGEIGEYVGHVEFPSGLAGAGEAGVRRGDDVIGGEAELLEQDVALGAGPEVLDADDLAGVADDLAPALRDRGLDADPGLDLGRDHLAPVGQLLRVEPLDARHRDDPGGRSFALEHARERRGPAPTSDPVATRITFGCPSDASARM